MVHPTPENDFRPVLRAAVDRGVGVIAIKAVARRRWPGERALIGDRPFTTWYEPFTEQADIDMAVWYTLSQEGVATYSMCSEVRLWPKIIDAAERFRPLSPEEQEEVVRAFREKGARPLFPE